MWSRVVRTLEEYIHCLFHKPSKAASGTPALSCTPPSAEKCLDFLSKQERAPAQPQARLSPVLPIRSGQSECCRQMSLRRKFSKPPGVLFHPRGAGDPREVPAS